MGHDHSHDHDHHNNENETTSLLKKTPTTEPVPNHDDSTNQQDDDTAFVLRRLYMATSLCLTFLLVEVIGGYLAGSLAVLSDAAHLFADLASFAVAIMAAHIAALPSSQQHTYGLRRVESLAALFSMATLAVISLGLALEAFRRIYDIVMANKNVELSHDGQPVDGSLMSLIATIGVLVNVVLAAVLGAEHHVHLPGAGGHNHDHSHDHVHEGGGGGGGGHDHHDHHHDNDGHQDHSEAYFDAHDDPHDHDHGHDHDRQPNYGSYPPHITESLHADEAAPHNTATTSTVKPKNVNLHAAYLHVLADLAQSVAVLVAGLIIWWKPQWHIVDPLATILFCCLVFYSTLGVMRSALAVVLEEVPPTISWQNVLQEIQNVPNAQEVHDLHIWSISQGHTAMSVHVHTSCNQTDEIQCILNDITLIAKRHQIDHATIQIQPSLQEDCVSCTMHPGKVHACVSATPPADNATTLEV